MTSKKRQLIFFWTYREWGGAQIYLIAIMKVAKPDWDITVVLPNGSSPEILGFLERVGVKIEFIDVPVRSLAVTVSQKLKVHLDHIRTHIASYRHLKKYDLSDCILHIEAAPWQSMLFLAALSLRRANVFITLHNAMPDHPKWRVFLWKTRMRIESRLRGFHIFASNKDTKNKIKGWVTDAFWEKVAVTYTCVDPDEIDAAFGLSFDRDAVRTTLNIDPNAFVVLCVGQFIDRKGRWIFLDAAKLVVEKDPSVQFVWMTPSLPSDEDRQRVEKYELGDNFRLVLSSSIGSTRQEILSFFQIGDLFVLPSFVEGLPIALLEAMAMKLPSISTNINAIPEAIFDGETGILIEAGDSKAIAQRILDLKEDPENCSRLAAAGHAFVIYNFDEREASRIAIAAYKECFADAR